MVRESSGRFRLLPFDVLAKDLLLILPDRLYRLLSTQATRHRHDDPREACKSMGVVPQFDYHTRLLLLTDTRKVDLVGFDSRPYWLL
jgi:hypothetical protein